MRLDVITSARRPFRAADEYLMLAFGHQAVDT